MPAKRPATGTLDPATARFARMQIERYTVRVQDMDEDGEAVGAPYDEERLRVLTWTPDSAGREHYARTEVLPIDAPEVERDVLRVPQALLDAAETLGGLVIAHMLGGSQFVTADQEMLP